MEASSTPAILKTQRLLLRSFEQADLKNVYLGLSHPDVIKYYGVHYNSLEDTKTQMSWFEELESTATGKWFSICSVDNKVFYGGIGLNERKLAHQKAEIGFWLLPDYWGKGIISEALPLVCKWAFDHWNLHRLEALVEPENTSSGKVLTRAGFSYEGTMIDCEIKNGHFISLAIYAMLRS